MQANAEAISEGSITKIKVLKTPDTMVTIFFVALFAVILSWLVHRWLVLHKNMQRK